MSISITFTGENVADILRQLEAFTAPDKPQRPAEDAKPQPPAEDAEALRARLRATLAPIMAGPRAAEAKRLVTDNGGSISKIPAEKLADVLAAAEGLA